MTDAEADISDTLKARSDQVNADDLVAGPLTVTISDVKRFSDDKQPLGLSVGQKQPDGKDQPWKPCKTVRRLLVAMWGKDPRAWIGRSVTLARDPTVIYSGKAVGGIRVVAASHITKPFEMSLSETRGAKKNFVIQPLKTDAANSPAPKLASPSAGIVEKYAARLAELKSEEIAGALVKFELSASTMAPETARQIRQLFVDRQSKAGSADTLVGRFEFRILDATTEEDLVGIDGDMQMQKDNGKLSVQEVEALQLSLANKMKSINQGV